MSMQQIYRIGRVFRINFFKEVLSARRFGRLLITHTLINPKVQFTLRISAAQNAMFGSRCRFPCALFKIGHRHLCRTGKGNETISKKILTILFEVLSILAWFLIPVIKDDSPRRNPTLFVTVFLPNIASTISVTKYVHDSIRNCKVVSSCEKKMC